MNSTANSEQQGVPVSAPFPSQPAAYSINLPPGAVYPSPPYGQVPMPPGYIPFQMPLHMPPQVPPQYPPQMPMPILERAPGCPPGLEYLTQIDQLLVHQQMELMEVMMGWETNNKYLVKNSLGQQVFFAVEENDCFSLQCCGPMRSFVINIQDNMGQTVMSLIRPLKCSACCCPCCLQEVIRRASIRLQLDWRDIEQC
ncbi:phospholipid scramblase 2-like [Clupea harengus]|uniref:Phospholipid scramblase n=1 Tax=Clupea harengus TaxID=7950 RepID=A0A8M1K962_CLUHA|nr:phospholipid scramblase 2-like [Clupea harengus]